MSVCLLFVSVCVIKSPSFPSSGCYFIPPPHPKSTPYYSAVDLINLCFIQINRLKLGRPFSEADSSGNSTSSSSRGGGGGQWTGGGSSIELAATSDAMGALNGNPSMRSSTGAGKKEADDATMLSHAYSGR